MSETKAISINGSGLSGGDGEGYASTITAMEQTEGLLGRVNEVVQDLGDTLTAKSVDAVTTGYLSELDDHLQHCVDTANKARTHAEEMHEPIANAVAGAGGSQNVADTDWYDDL